VAVHPADDEQIRRVLEASFLRALPTEATARLLGDAVVLDIPAGGVLYRDEDLPRSGVVVAGLIRVYLTSQAGRELTVRYARPGESLGAPTAVGGPVGVSAQAVTDSRLLMFSAATLGRLAAEDVRVAWPVAQEVTRLLYGVLDAFAGATFGSVRQRVARHLLDLASGQPGDARPVAEVSQQALADAAGTAREVVARTLHDLRAAGVIETTRTAVIVLDADRLEVIAATGEL
jgi:CRP/FNR family cyclic AMP-dependent transcriptional regulator